MIKCCGDFLKDKELIGNVRDEGVRGGGGGVVVRYETKKANNCKQKLKNFGKYGVIIRVICFHTE
jgi:hypothetical protein